MSNSHMESSAPEDLSIPDISSAQTSIPAVEVHLPVNSPVCVSCRWMHCI